MHDDLLERFSPEQFIALIAVVMGTIYLIISSILSAILTQIKDSQQLRTQTELKKEMIQKGFASKEMDRVLQNQTNQTTDSNSSASSITTVSYDSEFVNHLNKQELSTPSFTHLMDIFRSLDEWDKKAVLVAIREIAFTAKTSQSHIPESLETQLAKHFAGVSMSCIAQIMSLFRNLSERDKQEVLQTIKSFEEYYDFSQEDGLVALVRSLCQGRPNHQRRRILDDHSTSEVTSNIELEMRK
jgi:hypothetical protein